MEITGKKQKLRKNAFILFFLLPTLVCFCVFYLYPIATVVISSFAKWDYTNLNDMQMYSFGHLFDNYKYIFEKYPYFWEGLRNSCIWALCGLVVQVPIATGVALVISMQRMEAGKKYLRDTEYYFFGSNGIDLLTAVQSEVWYYQ